MSTSTEVMQVTTALAQFDRVAAGLAELEKSYKGVIYPVNTKDGMKAAVLARRAIKEPRVEVEKLRKAAKAPILELGRKLDSEAARITGALESLEGPIDAQIKQEEDRLHNEAVAKATAERERVEALEARLEALQLMPFDAQGLTSAQCQACLDEARALKIGEDWQEYAEKAERAKISAVAALEGMVAKALAAEAEAARIIAERAELDKLRAEAAARDVAERERQRIENERIAAEQKAEAERLAAVKAEQDRLDAERLAAHVKLEKEAAAARKAEQDKLDAERSQFEKDKAIAAAELKERIRIEQVGFRAHHENLTPAQRDQLRADSDADPTKDVYSLALIIEQAEKLNMTMPTHESMVMTGWMPQLKGDGIQDDTAALQYMLDNPDRYGFTGGIVNLSQAIEVPPLTEAITVAPELQFIDCMFIGCPPSLFKDWYSWSGVIPHQGVQIKAWEPVDVDAERAAYVVFACEFETDHSRPPYPIEAWLERAKRG